MSFLLVHNTYTKHFWSSRNFGKKRSMCVAKKLQNIGWLTITCTWPTIQLHLFTTIYYLCVPQCSIDLLVCVVNAETWSRAQSNSAIRSPVGCLLRFILRGANMTSSFFYFALLIGGEMTWKMSLS